MLSFAVPLLLANGFTEKCYDGKAFFATDHPVGKDKASNKEMCIRDRPSRATRWTPTRCWSASSSESRPTTSRSTV